MARPDTLRLAGASGTSGDGTIPTIPAGVALYVRCPSNAQTEKVEWAIQCNKAHSYQLYRAKEMYQSLATLTLSGLLNSETFFIMGNTYSGTTSTTTWSGRTVSIATSMDACAGLLAKEITGGSLVTLASCAVPDTVIVTGSNGVALTYTAHATTTTAASRQFSIAGTNIQDAAELVTCLNDATYGVPGVTATQGAGTGEVLINWTTPTGGIPPTVVGGTRRAVTTIGETYIYATASGSVVTLLWRPAYVDIAERKTPYVFSAQTGTAAGHAAFSMTFLASLYKDGAAVSSLTDNSTTGGTLYSHTVSGWPEAVIAVTNNDGTLAATLIIEATRLRFRE